MKVSSVQYGPCVQAGTAVDGKGAVGALQALGHLGVRTLGSHQRRMTLVLLLSFLFVELVVVDLNQRKRM